MTVWASPWYFLLILPLLALLAWQFWDSKWKRPTFIFSQVTFMKKIAEPMRARFKWLPLIFKCLGILLAIVALARPQRADTKIKRNAEGIDIMICWDISDSMLIEDMPPDENRMESAKHTIERFIKARVSDRIGVVVFAGESYTRVPLTLDYALLLKNVAAVGTSHNMKMGTAIGVGLADSVTRLKDSTAKSRIVIFLTDGENNTGSIDPDTAIDIAKGYGIRVYSIGIGKDGEAQLPQIVEDAFGRQVKRYRPIHSDINEDLLRKMAADTGGKYWRATDGRVLEGIFQEINRLEKTKVEINQYTKYAELFPPYLQWAVLLYFLGVFLAHAVFRRGP
jgi:Ca-activated chloride channel family protein